MRLNDEKQYKETVYSFVHYVAHLAYVLNASHPKNNIYLHLTVASHITK